ncbi:hypothetical protein ABIE26_004478 [Pedobacter africanus]|uniref:Uncharacterized protein n=1 Tax=Pedobacter africanus TaxID=151894 RepID=A0ACC6L3V6_9SPHI|nr:hypothetical protein [Pedobacter africanus]MDR6786052.1 hypothetical protein [Pedobacter africanus]
MKLISDILNDLMDDQLSLSVPLTKTKFLASKIAHQELLEWVNFELKGYPSNGSLPAYRITKGVIVGDMIKSGIRFSDHPFHLPDLPADLNEQMQLFRAHDNVSALESLLKSKSSNMVCALFPENILRTIEKPMKNTNGADFQLLRAGIKVPLHSLHKILAEVKDKLMEFMLALDKQFDVNTEIRDLKNNQSKITTIMNTTIHNNGDGNVINTGEKASITTNVSINKGNKQVLERKLAENNVAEQDIRELLLVIDEEPPVDQKFGEKVNLWLQKMVAKSLSGGWEISLGAAGSLLADAIKQYYGLG